MAESSNSPVRSSGAGRWVALGVAAVAAEIGIFQGIAPLGQAGLAGLVGAGAFFLNLLGREEYKRASLIDVIETSQELGSSATREKVLGRVVQAVKRLFSCDTAVVYLREHTTGQDFVLRVAESSTAVPDAFTDFDPKLRSSIVGVAVREKKPIRVDDFQQYNPEESIRREESLRSMMVVPLVFEEEVLGAILIASKRPGAYLEDNLHLFHLLASQVAVAVRNLQLHEKTAALAITDSLSGLYTHGYFQEKLGEEILGAKKSGQVLSLMILDVDFFKKVNDTYGHPQGDSLLKQLGALITELTRPTDVLCRYGGDEFTIILLNTNRISAVVIAERVREAVEGYEFVLGSQIVHVTVSGGVASFPEDAETKKELIEKADFAMYQAKQKGRNRVIFSS